MKTSTASDESDPTCTKYAEGCTSEIKMSTVRRRDAKKTEALETPDVTVPM